MAQPKVTDTKPIVLDLDPGSYYWCSCGYSGKQPCCDGSHQGTEFVPLKFEVETKKKVALCQCKVSQNPPFCDGSHSKV